MDVHLCAALSMSVLLYVLFSSALAAQSCVIYIFLKFHFILFTYLLLAALSHHCCVWAFLVAMCELLIAVTSLLAEHGLQALRLSSRGAPLYCPLAFGIFPWPLH